MKYIRQVLLMMREEKLFSAIHIAGTAMAIAFTMVMAVVYYIKLAPIYPEVNRMRTVYFDGIITMNDGEGGGASMTYFGAKAFEEWFMSSPNIEYCSPTNLAVGRGKYSSECQGFVLAKKGEYMEVILNWTSADFFKIYEYDFIEGRPFTKKQVEAREKVCVISEALAERLFGKDKEAKGQMVTMENGLSVRVTGVVRNGSQLTPDSYADLFLPYTLREDRYEINSPYTGHFSIVATVKDTEHLKALKQELAEIEARLTNNSSEILGWSTSSVEMGKKHVELGKDMETHPMHTLRRNNGGDWYNKIPNSQLIYHFAGLLFVLLFVPALNLCGIVAGRMERRTAEMGIRKTFGARRSTLLWQVVTENLVLTSIGGIIGLIISWLAIYGFRLELLSLFFDSYMMSTAPIVTGEMLFSPLLFVGCFIAVVVLNLLSALLPAWLSLRKPIVESMMERR